MTIFDGRNYSRALIIGAGSGRDMASCVLMTDKLRRLGVAADVGGFLTPWALHRFNGMLEAPVNELTGRKTSKFLASKEAKPLSSYFEPELLSLNEEFGLGIGKFYLFSLQYGTARLRNELGKLMRRNSYDLLIAFDIGGDILARKEDYRWLLTPIVDFSCLSILSALKTSADRYLIVAAPGVDGEIPCENLKEILYELEAGAALLESEDIDKGSSAYQVYRQVNEEINARTTSSSNTFRLIEDVLSAGHPDPSTHIEKRVRMGDRAWTLSFPVVLDPSLAKKIFYFQLEALPAARNRILSYGNLFDAFVTLKQLGAGGTEVDLAFVSSKIGGGSFADIIFLLTPCERIKGALRRDILEYGLSLTAGGGIARAALLEKDFQLVDLPSNLQGCGEDSWDTGGLVLVGDVQRSG